jgi:hypothetical protein
MVALRDPLEAWDRIKLKAAARFTTPPGTETRTGYTTDPQWSETLHACLGVAPPCGCVDGSGIEWDSLLGPMARRGEGADHDGDIALAKATWITCFHLRPKVVVETGVARGVTSRAILEAMDRRDEGHLWSVDLPPLSDPWWTESRSLVPQRLRSRWSYLRGDARRVLPRLLDRLGTIDVFVHDSLHTKKHMSWEFNTAKDKVGEGGFILSDDIGGNSAFAELCDAQGWSACVQGKHHRKSGMFGVARKSAA